VSLVIAVQPDRDQAAHVVAICRRLGVELIVEATAGEALGGLGNRVPDLILSPPLLPKADETCVADYLRGLGDAGIHIQALTVPWLGEPSIEVPPPSGLFASFFKPRRDSAVPAACDPALFAEQVSAYLLRSVAERARVNGTPDATQALLTLAAVPAAPIDEPEWAPNLESDALLQDPDPLLDAAFDAPLAAPGGQPDSIETSLETFGDMPEETLDLDAIFAPHTVDSGGELAPRRDAARRPLKHGRSKRRRVHDDDAYFDPARSTFASVVERFDEFIQSPDA
jgi:hypothetical protein